MRFVLVSFLFLGFAFYQLSGGADFEPRGTRSAPKADSQAAAETNAQSTQLEAHNAAIVFDTHAVARVQPVVTTSLEQAGSPTTKHDETRHADAVAAPARETGGLAFTFDQQHHADSGDVQLASLANVGQAFPQPTFLDPVAASLETADVAAPDPRPIQLDIRDVTGSRVNMRQGPGTTYAVIGTLFYDDRVEVLDDLGNGWVQLRKVGTNQVGWMASRFVGNPAN